MSEKLSSEDFWQKVEREGGVLELLAYGLDPEELEEGELKDTFRKLVELWGAPEGVQALLKKLHSLSPEA